MGILDAPPIKSLATGFLHGYGHSFLQISPGVVQTTLSGAHVAGATVMTVASTTTLEAGKTYQLRAADAANREYVTIPDNADVTTATVALEHPLAHDHANAEVVFDVAPLAGERIARMLGNPTYYANRAVSGATLAKGGVPTSQGGYNAVLQQHARPGNVTGATTEPSPGMNVCLWGLNDMAQANIDAAGTAALYQAWRQAMRSVLARFSLSLLYEAETAFPASSINTTFGGSGTWTSTSTTAGNSGTGYLKNATAGGTITHALPAGWAGAAGSPARYVDFCFVGNYVGGSIAASQISFTVDGVAAYPVGSNASGAYGAGNLFSTVDQNPATYATAVPCTARLLVTPTGNAQSIVATTGTGGAALDWIGYEADNPQPTIWAGTCATPGSTAGTIAAIPGLNAVSVAVIAEFTSSLIAYVDLYTTMSPAGVAVPSYWTTSVDLVHPNTAGSGVMAQEMFKSFQRLPLTIGQRANL